jgi:hypothetical protein
MEQGRERSDVGSSGHQRRYANLMTVILLLAESTLLIGQALR